MPDCRSCQAPIIWVRTSKGRALPVDRDPVRGGNLAIDNGVAVVVAPSGALRHVAHYATCPDAKDHRKRGAKNAGSPQLGLFGGKL